MPTPTTKPTSAPSRIVMFKDLRYLYSTDRYYSVVGIIPVKMLASILIVAVLAQDDARIVAKVEGVVFPPLLRMARIQGDVTLRAGPKGITLLSGHPLLARVAVDNLNDIVTPSEAESEFLYHFVIGDTSTFITRTTVKKGNAMSRFILHALRMKTEKVVESAECVPSPRPKNRIDLTKNPVEIWIYGLGACLLVSQTASPRRR
jgi:hypothetical protein